MVKKRAKAGEDLSLGEGVGIFCRGKKKAPMRTSKVGEEMKEVGGGGVVEDGDRWGNVWASGKLFLIYRDFQQSEGYHLAASWFTSCKLRIVTCPLDRVHNSIVCTVAPKRKEKEKRLLIGGRALSAAK